MKFDLEEHSELELIRRRCCPRKELMTFRPFRGLLRLAPADNQ